MESLWMDGRPEIATDPFTPGARLDVLVVGAGLTGLVTALLLARAGRKVAVLEARQVGAVTTGHTTAKISLLQGTTLSSMLKHTSDRVAAAYVEGNQQGQDWLLNYCAEAGVAVQRRPALTYARTARGLDQVKQEYDAAARLGLDVARVEPDELPFPVRGAVQLADQAQFDPVLALAALTRDVRTHGGRVHEGVRVEGLEVTDVCRVETSAGRVNADQVVIATGIPILDRGLYFAKLTPQRSYVVAARVPGPKPQGMYLSADRPTRSLRTSEHAGDELLLVGGNGHVVGRTSSARRAVEDLVSWTTTHFPGAEVTHRWSAQDYQSHNLVPFVGTMPRSRGRVWVATGYNKWGMTNAVAAALRIRAEISGEDLAWGKVLRHRVTRPRDVITSAQANGSVAVAGAAGWAAAAAAPTSAPDPAEGAATVIRHGTQPVGLSTVEGVTCAVSLVCPHLKGVLRWNDAELSWDCPLHGSRFSAAGSLLEGPATTDLERHASAP